MTNHKWKMVSVLISILVFMVCDSKGQEIIPNEDAQEVLTALADADMADESALPWQNQNDENQNEDLWRGQWDTRVSVSDQGDMDNLTRLKMQYSSFSARGRWRETADGTTMQAFTSELGSDSFKVHLGGVGMSVGHGLLVSRPGRSGGLAAGQSLSSPATRVRGWATSPEKRSVFGGGFSGQWKGWMVAGLHGRLGDPADGVSLSAVNLEKQLGRLKIGTGVASTGTQRGISVSGKFQDGSCRLGFEWALWEKSRLNSQVGVWLVSLKMDLVLGCGLEAQWAASNGSGGPPVGVRPAVLDAWGGAGWVVRVSSPPGNIWRAKILMAESRGIDWDGPHQNQAKQFIDVIFQGRPSKGWEVTGRWHHRIRSWEAWSEEYPWLPSTLVKEDERSGLSLNLKFGRSEGTWVCSLRNLGRVGAATNGTRTLASVRHRRGIGRDVSVLLSFQSAWGESVDLVTAINPIRGVLLPRHWGHWASEILVGLDFPVFGTRFMAAVSRRVPALGDDRQTETGFWAGARADW